MKKERLLFDEFRDVGLDQILTVEELQGVNGGCSSCQQKYSYDCVLNCFDYLDGSAHDYDYYRYPINYGLGYDPYNTGGVYTGDIATIGSYGGFTVAEITGSFNLVSTGRSNGNAVMMTYNAGGSGDHAVIVKGYEDHNGSIMIVYHDPTTGGTGRISASSGNFYTVQ